MNRMMAMACAAALCASAANAAHAALAAVPGAEVTVASSVTRELSNDEATVTLAMTRSDKSAAGAQQKLFADLAPAMKALREALSGTKAQVRTGNLATHPNYSVSKTAEASRIVSWTSSQSVVVTLQDVRAAGEVISAAGRHFEFSGLGFSVSRKSALENRSGMIADLMADITEKAKVIARSMELPSSAVKLKSVQFGDAGMPLRRNTMPMVAMAKTAREAPSPDIAAGTSELTLSASAVLQIGDKPSGGAR